MSSNILKYLFQHALSRVGAVIYADPLYHWAGSPSDLQDLWTKVSSKHGILTWPRRPAVTSLTHPHMFQYFHEDVDDYLFVQMVDASRVMVVGKLMRDVMKYWIQCALTLECIMPIGKLVLDRFILHTYIHWAHDHIPQMVRM